MHAQREMTPSHTYHAQSVDLVLGSVGDPDLPGQAGVVLGVTHQHVVGLQEDEQEVVRETEHHFFQQLEG